MRNSFILIILIGILASCDIQENVVQPGESFTQILDNNQFTGDINPLSIVETPDSGFLILAAKDNWNTTLIKTDIDGVPVWEQDLGESMVNPLPNIIEIEGSYFIACMDAVTLETHLLQIDLGSGQATDVVTLPELTYPLSVAYHPHELIIQGYDRENKNTLLNIYSDNFSLNKTFSFPTQEDREEDLIRHLNRTGTRWPFFCGKLNSSNEVYFLNGFSDYAMSLLFVDGNSGEMSGNVSGYRSEEFASAFTPLSNDKYAYVGQKFKDTYILPFMAPAPGTFSYLGDLIESSYPEIGEFSKMVVREAELNGKYCTLYGTHAKNNSLLFYIFDQNTEKLTQTKYIGQTIPYSMGDFKITSDGGMIILAKTYVANRFPRLVIFKLTASEVLEMAQ